MKTVWIQELNQNLKPRKNVPPKEVTEGFWLRLKQSVVGGKRYKVVKAPKKDV
jgi:hypothetical protein